MDRTQGFAQVERVLADPVGALGSGAVGFVGPDIPIEVLLGSGRSFGHLPWRSADATPWADRWLESSFPLWARSILEQWHAGAFEPLESVVFTRGEDVSQRLFYYVAELQRRKLLRGPRPVIFDIAYSRRESSNEHTASAILKLTRALGIDEDSLRDGVDRANGLRRKLTEIQRLRLGSGPAFERLGRAVLWSDPVRWIDEISFPGQIASGPRVLLAGSVPPDARIHQAVEDAGASVVAEAHVFGLGRLGRELAWPPRRPELALAGHLREASLGPRAFFDRAQWIVEQAGVVQADAVIIWLTREDEALAWHVPSQRRALEAAGIRKLVIAAADWNAESRDLDRIAEFVGNEVLQ